VLSSYVVVCKPVATCVTPETAPSMGLRLLRVFPLRINSGGGVKTRFSVLDNPIDLAAGYNKGALYFGVFV
jgi:hypothetical protein